MGGKKNKKTWVEHLAELDKKVVVNYNVGGSYQYFISDLYTAQNTSPSQFNPRPPSWLFDQEAKSAAEPEDVVDVDFT